MDKKGLIVSILVFGGLLVACFVFGVVLLKAGQESSPYSGEGPRIGVAEIMGPIVDSKEILERLEALRRDDSIRAVVVRIDSPGGAVGPSQEIFRAIERTREKKKVVASLGAVAASGGYYAASAADRIIASPGTITGSIGVITQVADISELMSLAKIRTEVFKSGALKDTGSPFRPLNAEDRAHLDGLVKAIYEQFVGDVARVRKVDAAEIRPIADGRVMTGEQALKAKLIDELGNFNDALAAAAQLAGAKGEPVPVYPQKRELGALLRMLESTAGSLDIAATTLREWTAGGPKATIEVRDPLLRE